MARVLFNLVLLTLLKELSAASRSLYILVAMNSTTASYPVVEGENVTLKCENVNTSQLITQYTWPDTAGGQPSGQYLVFDNVTREHHGRPVRCMASYDSSVIKEPLSSETLVMQVYYPPDINVTCDDSGCEQIKSSPNEFAVTQGRNVTFLCQAGGNPPPDIFSWHGVIYSNNKTLNILSPDRSMHGSRFICRVVTKQFPDERHLRLVSYYEITIIIKYPPAVQKFQLNAVDNSSLTVAENSSVELLCQADGRPAPRMIFASNHSNDMVTTRPQGDILLNETMAELRYVLNASQCVDSGDYRCEADNGEGLDSKTIRLFVLCAPRRNMSDEDPPYLDVRDNKGHLSLTMTAYPTPYIANKTYCGASQNASRKNETAEDRIDVSCTASPTAPALVTCNVFVVDVSIFAEGLCKIVFRNSLGELTYIFRLKHHDSGRTEELSSHVGAIIGGTIGGLIIVVAAVTTFVVLFRRRKGDLRHVSDSRVMREQNGEIDFIDPPRRCLMRANRLSQNVVFTPMMQREQLPDEREVEREQSENADCTGMSTSCAQTDVGLSRSEVDNTERLPAGDTGSPVAGSLLQVYERSVMKEQVGEATSIEPLFGCPTTAEGNFRDTYLRLVLQTQNLPDDISIHLEDQLCVDTTDTAETSEESEHIYYTASWTTSGSDI